MRHRFNRVVSLRFVCFLSLFVVWTTAVSTSTSAIALADEIEFGRDIQPILAEHCFACHGPDQEQRQADLRLDQREGLMAMIDIDQAADSELLLRVHASGEEQMPPAEFNKPLNDQQKELLLRWIQDGAVWQDHWAFQPIKKPTPPADSSGWAKGEIDQFLLARMKSEGLQPSAMADPATRLRRLYFDLIGIAPTPDEVDAFLNDREPGAWERAIDRLFNSPHYGERMAVGWLDLARYADTNGYQNDFVRSMWPWRDWVIRSFNQKMPMDEFIVQQMAGDLLPNPTQEQLIATGFHRNNHSVTEGGTIEEEWRIENCVDRVETTSATFLGLTMGCARCHDHKYDPVSQREFYQFFAFFNNVDEKGVYNEFRGNTEPLLKVPTQEQSQALAQVETELSSVQQELNRLQEQPSGWQEVLSNWRDQLSQRSDAVEPDYVWNNEGETELGDSPVGQVAKLNVQAAPAELEGKPNLNWERDQGLSWSVWIEGGSTGSIFGKMDDQPYRGVDGIILNDGRLKLHWIAEWPGNSIAVIAKPSLAAGRWYHVSVTYDGSSKAAGIKVYLDGKPVSIDIERDSLDQSILTQQPFQIGQRRNSVFFSGRMQRFQLFGQPLNAEEVTQQWQQSLVDHQGDSEAVGQYLGGLQNQELQQKLAQLQEQQKKLVAGQQTTMIMRERDGYRETYRLNRGQYDQPDQSEKLWPTIPSVLPPLTEDQPANRLGLAKWLVDTRNPLVARVIVNREWARFFGRGLVDTPDNFGLQGSPPTHPLLLDWLAFDFRDNGWDLQRLQKQILMSAAYQQKSQAGPDAIQLDRENRWVARGPRHRLSAEQIRDHALSISGLLVDEIGGPSVFPYQPAGLWEELAGGANNGPYRQSHGKDLYRRTLYTYRKRTVPHPVTATMDAPAWEICQVQRSRTNTPLQALALLNDVTYVEAARALALRALGESDASLTQQLEFAFRSAVGRMPTDSEGTQLQKSFDQYLQYYDQNPTDAKSFLEVGEYRGQSEASLPQQAAMATVCAVLLNMDETISKQ